MEATMNSLFNSSWACALGLGKAHGEKSARRGYQRKVRIPPVTEGITSKQHQVRKTTEQRNEGLIRKIAVSGRP